MKHLKIFENFDSKNMSIKDVKDWVYNNVCDYEPEYTEYDIDQATGDMLYNFFTDELNQEVEPDLDVDDYEWEHKQVLIDEFRRLWSRYYN